MRVECFSKSPVHLEVQYYCALKERRATQHTEAQWISKNGRNIYSLKFSRALDAKEKTPVSLFIYVLVTYFFLVLVLFRFDFQFHLNKTRLLTANFFQAKVKILPIIYSSKLLITNHSYPILHNHLSISSSVCTNRIIYLDIIIEVSINYVKDYAIGTYSLQNHLLNCFLIHFEHVIRTKFVHNNTINFTAIDNSKNKSRGSG